MKRQKQVSEINVNVEKGVMKYHDMLTYQNSC